MLECPCPVYRSVRRAVLADANYRRFGSPFDHNPLHAQDLEYLAPPVPPGDDNLPERPREVVVWNGVSAKEVSEVDQYQHAHLHDHADGLCSPASAVCAKNLGKVKFFVRWVTLQLDPVAL